MKNPCEMIGLNENFPAVWGDAIRGVNEVYDAKEKASAVARQAYELLKWRGYLKRELRDPSEVCFWREFDELLRVATEQYGEIEELT